MKSRKRLIKFVDRTQFGEHKTTNISSKERLNPRCFGQETEFDFMLH